MRNTIERIKGIKDLFLNKLDTVLLRLDDLNYSLNTLLKVSSYLVESQQDDRAMMHQLNASMISDTHVEVIEQSTSEQNCALSLIAYLYSFLPNRKAIDLGVTLGQTDRILLDAGYEVIALTNFQDIPVDAGVVIAATQAPPLKDLPHYPLMMVSLRDQLKEQVLEMRTKGYHWHLVIYRDEEDKIRFYANTLTIIAKSSGNVLFFQQYEVFNAAWKWCTATLTPTLFKG
jgi:hypothetical protein